MKYSSYAPTIIRLGLGLVFFLIGLDQLSKPDNWLSWLPQFITQISPPQTLILAIGIFNIIVGALLILGLFTKLASLLAGLHLLGIILTAGYSDITIRDMGLLFAAIAIFLNGPDKFTLDKKRK